MDSQDVTCWTLIEDAAGGKAIAREEFTRRYLPVVRATLRSRWRGRALEREITDAVQDVFVDCFKPDGALTRADRSEGSGFRGFLFGVTRNVALRAEERHARRLDVAGDDAELADASTHEATMSAVFDRSWASALVNEAGELHASRARERGADCARRLELLALRFKEDLPIRDIAKLWSMSPEYLHHQYAQARAEYRDCLREVVAFHQGPQSTERLDEECQRLLALLGA